MRKKFLFLYVMICMLGSTAYALPYTTKADVTVLMYHLISDNSDEWSDYCISSQTFENDIKTLLAKGYTFMAPSELTQPVKAGKYALITFDDGYESNYVYAHPILQKYNLKANIAPVVKSTEDITEENQKQYTDYDTPHLSFAQLQKMQESGVWEIGSHSYDGHGEITIDNKGKTGPFLNNHIADPETKEVEKSE